MDEVTITVYGKYWHSLWRCPLLGRSAQHNQMIVSREMADHKGRKPCPECVDGEYEPEPRAALEYEPAPFLPATGSIMDPEFDELIQRPREPFQGR